MRSRPVLGYSLLFFLSGATGLVYELLWVRLLHQSFGSTIQSVTTVVAAYMGGLGLGAWLLGRRADRHARPAALYGRLEILIGLFGLVSPLVLSLAQQAYIAIARGFPPGSSGSVVLRFGLAGLVLLVPTTLMAARCRSSPAPSPPPTAAVSAPRSAGSTGSTRSVPCSVPRSPGSS